MSFLVYLLCFPFLEYIVFLYLFLTLFLHVLQVSLLLLILCIYLRLAACGAPDFGIFYVEKGVFTCTRVHVLNNMCSHAGENTILWHDLTVDCQISALMQAIAPYPCMMSHAVFKMMFSPAREHVFFKICIPVHARA